jgi:predicted deacylase
MALQPIYAQLDEFHLGTIDPGNKVALWLEAGFSPLGTVQIPALVARGHKPGRTLLAVAGVHGDEFEGMVAIRNAFEELNVIQMSGSYIALPVCNPLAYEALSRTTPGYIDGENMARVFPGDPQGRMTQRLAHCLFSFVLRHLTPSDLFLDFHSSGTRYRYLPMIGYVNEGEGAVRAREAARRFGVNLLWELPPGRRERFNAEVGRLGIPAIGTETSGQGGCRDEDVEQYTKGIRNTLRYLEIVDGPSAAVNMSSPVQTQRVYCEASGFFQIRQGLELGDLVEQGGLIGVVRDPLGRERWRVTSPVDSRLVAVRTFPAVWTGDIAALIYPT